MKLSPACRDKINGRLIHSRRHGANSAALPTCRTIRYGDGDNCAVLAHRFLTTHRKTTGAAGCTYLERKASCALSESSKHISDAAALVLEAQGVIAMRLVKIAAGGPAADAECHLMVAEKFAAYAAAHGVAAAALASGKSFPDAAALALVPVRREVRANHRRLSRG
jgi:hypothetical protein